VFGIFEALLHILICNLAFLVPQDLATRNYAQTVLCRNDSRRSTLKHERWCYTLHSPSVAQTDFISNVFLDISVIYAWLF